MDIYENQTPEGENRIPAEEDPETPQPNAAEETWESAPAMENDAQARQTAYTYEEAAPDYQEPLQEVRQAASAYEEPEIEESQPVRRTSPYEDSPYVINHVPQQPKAKKAKKKGGFWKTAVCAVLILALVAGACAATGMIVNEHWEDRMDRMEDSFEEKLAELQQQIKYTGTGVSSSGTPNYSADGGMTPAQVYAKNVQSVVMIYNMLNNGTATGSGFILTEDGYVVTNYHVVEGGGSLSVVTCMGQEYEAKLIGYDATNDVALLKVEAERLQAVTLGSSDDLIVGDQVVAIGNPLGELTSTLTVGYISAKERDVNTDGFAINMLQTDAAINSGNSGGPLFNMKGEVIGITTAKYSGTSSSGASIEGVGFAIPIDDVTGLLSDLATHGYIKGAYLGVSVSDMDPAAASYYGLPMGAYVQKVEKGFAAERAGIQPKDIIVNVGGIEVETVNDLTRALRNFDAGDVTVITVYRGGREIKLEITLDDKPVTTPD